MVMGETITVIKRDVGDGKYVFDAVMGDEELPEYVVERAESVDGSERLGKVVAIYCFDASEVPSTNSFTGDLSANVEPWLEAQLQEALGRDI